MKILILSHPFSYSWRISKAIANDLNYKCILDPFDKSLPKLRKEFLSDGTYNEVDFAWWNSVPNRDGLNTYSWGDEVEDNSIICHRCTFNIPCSHTILNHSPPHNTRMQFTMVHPPPHTTCNRPAHSVLTQQLQQRHMHTTHMNTEGYTRLHLQHTRRRVRSEREKRIQGSAAV